MPVVTRSQTKAKAEASRNANPVKSNRNFVELCIKRRIKPTDYFEYSNILQYCKQASFEHVTHDDLKKCSKFQLQTILRVIEYMMDNKVYYDYKNYTLTDEELNGASILHQFIHMNYKNLYCN